VVFDTVGLDDYSAVKSTTNFQPGVGMWYLSGYFSITKQAGNAVGARGIRIVTSAPSATTIAGSNCTAAPSIATELTIGTAFRITDPAVVIQLHAYHAEGATLQVQSARFWLSKIGSGPQGVQGIQGVQGNIGPAGPTGPTGPAGAGANATTTFAQIAAS
jgi:hypothetical protein